MDVVLLTSYYYKPHVGGVENSIYYLAKEYSNKGNKVIILASDAAIDKSQRLSHHEIIDGIEVYRFRHFIPWNSFFYLIAPAYDLFFTWTAIRKIMRVNRVSLIIARHHISALAATLLYRRGVKVSYLIPGIVKYQNSLELFGSPEIWKSYLMDWYKYLFLISQQSLIQRLSMLRVDNLYVFSELMREQTLTFLGNKKISVKQISPGVDTERYNNYNRLFLRDQEAISKDEYVFLFLGRITIHKGIDMAIKAFSILYKKHEEHNLKFLIVGDGPELYTLKKMVAELELENLVVFKGETKSPEKFYALADDFLMTSISETFGQTILEAMASGLPIIGFKSSEQVATATENLIIDEVHGTLCNYSVTDLAIAMEKHLLLGDKRKSEIAIENRNYVQNNFSWSKLVNEDLNI